MPVVKLHYLCLFVFFHFFIDNFHGRHTDDMHVWERKKAAVARMEIWIHVSIYTWRHSRARRI